MGLEIFAATLSPGELIRSDYVAHRVGSYIKEGAQLNAKLVKEALQARSQELAGHSFNRDIISEAQAVRRDIFAGFAGVEVGLEELKATFDWGFGQVIWQLELQQETLQDILKVLQAPLDTQAKELRGRAEYAYQNGWIDKAERDFLESEGKNYQDFSVHFSLGMIYLYHKIDFEKALGYFRQTVKYAKPSSSHYTAQGWFYTGFVFYLQHEYSEAIEAMNQVLEINPEFSEAHYQLAKNFALLDKPKESIENLRKAIEADADYCLKADMDRDFDGIRTDINALFKQLREEIGAEIMRVWKRVSKDEIEKIVNEFDRLYSKVVEAVKKHTSVAYPWPWKKDWLKREVTSIEEMIKERNHAFFQLKQLGTLEKSLNLLLGRESYFDNLEALIKTREYNRIAQPVWDFRDIFRKQGGYYARLQGFIKDIDESIQTERAFQEFEREDRERLQKRRRRAIAILSGSSLLGGVIGASIGGVPGFFLGGIIGFVGFFVVLFIYCLLDRN